MAAPGARTDGGGQGGSPLSEQDSGILDVEDEEEEDDEVRKLHSLLLTHGCLKLLSGLWPLILSPVQREPGVNNLQTASSIACS